MSAHHRAVSLSFLFIIRLVTDVVTPSLFLATSSRGDSDASKNASFGRRMEDLEGLDKDFVRMRLEIQHLHRVFRLCIISCVSVYCTRYLDQVWDLGKARGDSRTTPSYMLLVLFCVIRTCTDIMV